MVDHFQSDPPPTDPNDQNVSTTPGKDHNVDVARAFNPLPAYVKRQLPGKDEEVIWVRGPRLGNPVWEPFVTNPLLFVVGVAIGALCIYLGSLGEGSGKQFPVSFGVGAVVSFFLPILLLAFFNGYFTRLVVTDSGVYIIQGSTICRNWELEYLPRSLVRFERRGEDDPIGKTVDVDAMKTMLNSSEGHFTDAKTIKDFGKRLERLRRAEDETH